MLSLLPEDVEKLVYAYRDAIILKRHPCASMIKYFFDRRKFISGCMYSSHGVYCRLCSICIPMV